MKLSFHREREVPSRAVPTQADFPAVSGANIAGMVHGQRVGGDLYHFLRANPNRVVFGLLDVAGSHEENHPIVSAARQTFQKLGSERFAEEEINEADTMMEFCLELNLSIRRAAAGGRSPGLLCDPSGITELPATGLPLGLFSASTYEAPIAALQPGASLLLVSRGVVEAAYKKEEFGLERVKQQLERSSVESAKGMAAAILDGVQQFMRAAPAQNDFTALALVRAAKGQVAIGA